MTVRERGASTSPRVAVHGVLAVATAAALWGTVGIASKFLYGTAEISPVFVGFVRLAVASPVLLILSLATVGRRTFAFAGRELGGVHDRAPDRREVRRAHRPRRGLGN